MASAPELYPLPLAALAARFDRELAAGGPIFGLTPNAIWRPDPARSLAFAHFGQPLATPLGPAAGPHTQLAQNILAGWLGGARFFELKTVQVLDALELPRPCIHAPNVGYNVEWSQELRVSQSAAEYAKAWLLVHYAAERLGLPVGTIFDLSCGYDLAGIRGEKVASFLTLMQDATPLLGALRDQLPVNPPTRISRSITLSTFHGCPAGEIEAICAHLLQVHKLDVVVKLNPTLLGEAGVRAILHDQLGYSQITLDPHAFAADLRWDQLLDMVPRLQRIAADEGLGFGAKFSNTLVCRSPDAPFGDAPFGNVDVYLSGPPLHPLAATLAARFIAATGGTIPVTFSAGVDAQNFSDVVAAGIGPVTTCTDLLKGKGYGRLCGYLRKLEARMAACGAGNLSELPRTGPTDWAAAVCADPRYAHAANRVSPRKVGTHLVLLDCLTCDKCVPVCPNLAIQTLDLPPGTWPAGTLVWHDGEWSTKEGPSLQIGHRHQIGIVADVCNECGQCDPTCPESGGPFATKPTLFTDPAAWNEHPARDGFHFDGATLWWRRRGDYQGWTPLDDGTARWTTAGGTVIFADVTTPPVATTGGDEADLRDAILLSLMFNALPGAFPR